MPVWNDGSHANLFFFFFFFLGSRLSIAVIYLLAKNTRIVYDDPICWFCLMLMPQGPPALVISGLGELADISEQEKMAIAKTLSVR